MIGKDSLVNRRLFHGLWLTLCLLLPLQAVQAQKDVPASKDPALFTRMPGFHINQYEEKQFASFSFRGRDGNPVAVEGTKLEISYAWSGTGKKPSSLQVIANYENAIKRIGGEVVHRHGDAFTTLKLVKDGQETWAQVDSEVDAGWGGYIVTIVAKAAMEQQVVASAAVMKADIRATGHVAVYGINFDTGKSEIKPGSESAIAEIARLLAQDASLRLHVVGHTDNVGELAANLTLSQARAEAVRRLLVDKHKVAPARLTSFGAGAYCPVDTNATPQGRARNRRVELVQQ